MNKTYSVGIAGLGTVGTSFVNQILKFKSNSQKIANIKISKIAVKNIRKMLKENGVLYGYVPYLFYYHAPRSLKYQDYFRFSKDALSYLFKDFQGLEIFPIRGRVSTPLNILFAGRWKRYIEKTGINIFLDKLVSDTKNSEQCSGFNFIVKK